MVVKLLKILCYIGKQHSKMYKKIGRFSRKLSLFKTAAVYNLKDVIIKDLLLILLILENFCDNTLKRANDKITHYSNFHFEIILISK